MKKFAVSSIVEEGAVIGDGTQIGYFCHITSETIIGENCKIGNGVQFTGMELRSQIVPRKNGKTKVGNNVVIGANATIVGNTLIGDGARIADGATVISYVPPFSFVAGNPARHIYSLSSIKA